MKRAFLSAVVIAANTAGLLIVVGLVYYVYLAINHPIRSYFRYDTPSWFAEDPYIGYVLRPRLNINVSVGNSTQQIFTDEYGNRAISHDADPLSHADIVSIGCSQTWGHGVSAEQTFSHVTGKLLDMSSVNLGVPSYGGVTSLRKLQRFWNLKPKYVVYGYWSDHDNRNLSPCAGSFIEDCLATPYVDIRHGEPKIAEPLPGNGKRLKIALDLIRDTGKGRNEYSVVSDMYWLFRRDMIRALYNSGVATLVTDRYQTNFPKEEQELASRYVLRILAKEVRAHGATLIVVYIPNYFEKTLNQPIPTFLADELVPLGAGLIDMTSEFNHIRSSLESNYLQVEDGHLSVAAHEMISQRIAKFIQTR